ncbi:MAG: RepB family plasmid replication initiator protein, partial [Patescibacteria group bacterium]
MKEKRLVVRKHNQLINARYSFSLAETRLVLKLLSLININDEIFKRYKIEVKDFDDITKHKGLSEYERVKQTIEDLQKKLIHIPLEDGFLQTAWIASAKYFEHESMVRVEISEELRPYLLQLKEHFTWYELEQLLSLSSAHSFRIYELLKQYQNIGVREFEMEELKEILNVKDKYKLYNDFRRRVILQAQKELEQHTDIRFDFKPLKKRKKVTHLKFFIYPNQKEALQESVQKITNDQVIELTRLFNSKTLEHKISEQAMLKIIKKYKIDYEKMISYIENIPFNNSYNPITTLIAVLKGSYVLPDNSINAEHKRRIEEENEKRKQEELIKEQERRKREEDA